MSGAVTGGIPPIGVRVEGADAAARSLDSVGDAAERMGGRTEDAARRVGTLATAADAVGEKIGTLSTRVQALTPVLDRLGFEQASRGLTSFTSILDQAASVASRIGANVAAAETGVSAFLARFATTATIAGTVAFGLQAVGLGIRSAGEGALSASEASARYNATLEAVNATLQTTEQRARAAAQALFETNRQAAVQRLNGELSQTFEQRSAAINSVSDIDSRLATARANLARAEQRAGRGSQAALPYAEAQRAEIARLEVQQREAVARFETANTREESIVAALNNQRRLQGPDDTYGPPAPARPAATGGGTARPAPQFGPLDGTDRAYEAFQRSQERIDAARQRALEQEQDRNARVTDRIVDYSAERFADLFDKNGRGWKGMLETFEQTARVTVSRIAAELVLRPIIAPVVSALGLGSLGTGNGGFSGFGRLFGGGGGAVAADGEVVDAAGGGGVDLGGIGRILSLGKDAYSALTGGSGGGGGVFGSVSSLFTSPIYTSATGIAGTGFGASAAGLSSATNSALAGLGAGVYGPATPAAVGAASAAEGGTLGAIGGVSLGTYAAGIGLGYGAGTLIGNSIARTDAQRTNVQIGSGTGAVGGAVAGAAIGSVIPGIGTAIGAIIGGLVGGSGGGALGGIIGPSRQFSGGDVGIGVDGNGQLAVVGAGGKRFNAGAAIEDTQKTLDSINAVLSGSGTRIVGAPGYDFRGRTAIGQFGYGQSTAGNDIATIFGRAAPYLQSSNSNLQRSLDQGRIGSFDELANAYNFIVGTYEPLTRASTITNQFQQSLDALSRTFNDAIGTAQRLGLEETSLIAERDRATARLTQGRDLQGAAIDANLASRISGDPTAAALANFDLSAFNEKESLRQQLGSLGLDIDSRLALLDQAQSVERQKVATASGSGIGGGLGSDLAVQLTVGGLGGLSPEAQYLAGLQYLNSARGQGLGAFTSAVQSVLPAARNYLGTSERYASLVAGVGSDLRALGGDPNGLTAILDAQAGGTASLDRIAGFSEQLLSVQQDALSAIKDLALRIETLIARRAAA